MFQGVQNSLICGFSLKYKKGIVCKNIRQKMLKNWKEFKKKS